MAVQQGNAANSPQAPTPYGWYGYPAYGYAYPNANGYGGHPYAGYSYAYPYPYNYYGYYPYYAYPMPPRRPPGEIYALVVSWVVISLGALSIVGGLLALLGLLLIASSGPSLDLSILGSLSGFIVAPLLGGILALFYGITRVMHRPSRRITLPRSWVFLALTALALGTGVVLWDLHRVLGSALAVLPLVILSGTLPAFAILAYGIRRLGGASTRRHLWMSLFYGATLAPLLAIILETILAIVTFIAFEATGHPLGSGILNLDSNPSTTAELIFTLIMLSVIAPVVEEGLKPLGAVLIIGRIGSAAEAFLLGLAAGIGFAVFETLGYISSGEVDWVVVAIERIGAGLLHGLGAGFAALGWYYLIRGKGVRLRWLRGFGGIAYAMLQHAVFNASNLIGLIPGLDKLLSQPIHLGDLPLDATSILFFVYYLILVGVLVYMARWLARDFKLRADTAAALPMAGGVR
jgi:RsiW-degrading membrane proteinase PrsW (M82 family)